MGFIPSFLTALGLAMDACAVSICKGLNMKKMDYRLALRIALLFGGFQALMPTIGWILGTQFKDYITSIDHWIAFVLLGIIGGKMIVEACHKGPADDTVPGPEKNSMGELIVLAIATSIDALAVGITFAFLSISIVMPVILIGFVTFILSFAGVMAGNRFGLRFKSKAELFGGIILVLIGTKILLEHLGII